MLTRPSMHTYKTNRATFLYNGDFSGNVNIVYAGQEITLPVQVLVSFVAAGVRRMRMAQLEGSLDSEVLGVELGYEKGEG